MTIEITALIPCKNEIANIDACVAAARAVATEVLVADSGSTDGTLERAREIADRVIEREYIDSGDFKNWAIPQATHRWVFIIDADERVTSELAAEIQVRLAANENCHAYSVPRRNFFMGHPLDHGDWARDRVTRLILRDECRYRLYTDHSEIEVPAERLGNLTSKLVHYTAWDPDEYLVRMTHYAEQQAKLWLDRGKKPRWIHIALNAPMRFLRGYLWRAGFRDGAVGFHVACLTAYYSFLKQFLFWQRCSGRDQRELDADYAASSLQWSPNQSSNAGTREAA